MINTDFILTGAAIAALLVLGLWRCSGGAYGTLTPSEEVSAAYARGQVDPEKNYYISGSAAFPSAIIGIDKAWTLDSDLWKRVDPTGGKLKELVEGMNLKAEEQLLTLQGYHIRDERRGVIGDWFSLPGMNIVIKRTGEKMISVTTPSIETWQSR